MKYHLKVKSNEIIFLKKLPDRYNEEALMRYIEKNKIDEASIVKNIFFKNEAYDNNSFLKVYKERDVYILIVETQLELHMGQKMTFEEVHESDREALSVEITFGDAHSRFEGSIERYS